MKDRWLGRRLNGYGAFIWQVNRRYHITSSSCQLLICLAHFLPFPINLHSADAVLPPTTMTRDCSTRAYQRFARHQLPWRIQTTITSRTCFETSRSVPDLHTRAGSKAPGNVNWYRTKPALCLLACLRGARTRFVRIRGYRKSSQPPPMNPQATLHGTSGRRVCMRVCMGCTTWPRAVQRVYPRPGLPSFPMILSDSVFVT